VLALSWSGGKDSALALHALREGAGPAPRALITTVTADYGRISMHGVRRELLRRQAQAAGLPLVEVEIPAGCSNDVYEQRMGQTLAEAPLDEAETIAFGDLFLADVRAYREVQLRRVGKEAIFPLWHQDTSALAHEFIAAGFEATIVCVDPRRLAPSFAGRRFDRELLADLPPDVDPCGENGEFHTFVHAGPIFTAPIACERGEVVERDGFVFCDMLATTSGAETRLATYGTLAPGRQNHGQLSELPGRWIVGHVRGELVEAGWGASLGYPGLILDPDAAPVEVSVFESGELPGHWDRLDAFEGDGYRRVAVDVATAEGALPASIYVVANPAELSR
jgi:uncharacterized protein (TIGR00290 family)